MVPALLFNISIFTSDTGVTGVTGVSLSGVAQVSLGVISIFLAPAATLVAIRAVNIQIFAFAALLAGLCIFFNLTSALDRISVSRGVTSGVTQVSSENVERLKERRHDVTRRLEVSRGVSQGFSFDIIGQDIATYESKIEFKRTKGCDPKSTSREDSIDFCTMYRSAKQRLEAARIVDALTVELREIDAKLESGGPVLEADPGAANFAAILRIEEGTAVLIYNIRAAVLTELVAVIGPIVINSLFGMIWGLGREKRQPTQESEGRAVDCTAELAFASQCLVKTEGQHTPGGEIRAAYEAWCSRMKVRPISRNSFAAVLADMGYEKKRGSRVVYQNVSINPYKD